MNGSSIVRTFFWDALSTYSPTGSEATYSVEYFIGAKTYPIEYDAVRCKGNRTFSYATSFPENQKNSAVGHRSATDVVRIIVLAVAILPLVAV